MGSENCTSRWDLISHCITNTAPHEIIGEPSSSAAPCSAAPDEGADVGGKAGWLEWGGNSLVSKCHFEATLSITPMY